MCYIISRITTSPGKDPSTSSNMYESEDRENLVDMQDRHYAPSIESTENKLEENMLSLLWKSTWKRPALSCHTYDQEIREECGEELHAQLWKRHQIMCVWAKGKGKKSPQKIRQKCDASFATCHIWAFARCHLSIIIYAVRQIVKRINITSWVCSRC